MKVLTELNRVKFEFGPCPDALLLSPPTVNSPVQCPLDEVHPFFKCCGTKFDPWPQHCTFRMKALYPAFK